MVEKLGGSRSNTGVLINVIQGIELNVGLNPTFVT